MCACAARANTNATNLQPCPKARAWRCATIFHHAANATPTNARGGERLLPQPRHGTGYVLRTEKSSVHRDAAAAADDDDDAARTATAKLKPAAPLGQSGRPRRRPRAWVCVHGPRGRRSTIAALCAGGSVCVGPPCREC